DALPIYAGEPQHTLHVGGKNLVESFVRNPGQRTVVGVYCGVCPDNVDAAPFGEGFIHQSLQFLAPRDVARPRQDFEPLLSNPLRTSSQASAFLLQSAILAPARASSSAIDLPMPRVAPVTS